jgi:hypothetical protein
MELRLHLLDSFLARGSDGATYKVRAYDRLAPDASLADGEHWESTGVSEYRLEDGRLVEVQADGSMRIARTDVALTPQGAS